MKTNMIEGNPLKQITLFSIPIIIGNLFQQFYQVIDTLIVGRFVGVEALAALGVSGPIGFTLIGFALGISTGFSVIVSQKFGAGDEEGVRKSIAMSIIATFICSIIITLIAYFLTRPLLILISTPENILDLAESYFRIIVYGIITIMYYNTFSSILRSIGDSKTPLFFLIFSSALNVIGDLICVKVLNMGVQGAAVATVIAQTASAILTMLYIKTKYKELWPQKGDWKYNAPIVRRLLSIGIPSGFHFSLISIGILIVQANLNGFGSNTVAGFGVGIRIESLFEQSFVGFGVGITTYCGQNVGALKIDRVREGVKNTFLLTVILAIVSGIVQFLFSYPISNLFISESDTEVLNASITYIRTVSIFYIFLAAIFIFRSASQGLGSGLIPLICAFQEILFRVLAIILFVPLWGYIGICLASPFAWIATGSMAYIFYRYLLNKIAKQVAANKPVRIF
jgi:putative MATE family efflux protein